MLETLRLLCWAGDAVLDALGVSNYFLSTFGVSVAVGFAAATTIMIVVAVVLDLALDLAIRRGYRARSRVESLLIVGVIVFWGYLVWHMSHGHGLESYVRTGAWLAVAGSVAAIPARLVVHAIELSRIRKARAELARRLDAFCRD